MASAITSPLAEKLVRDSAAICSKHAAAPPCLRMQQILTELVNQEMTSSAGQLNYFGFGGNALVLDWLTLNGTVSFLFGTGTTTHSKLTQQGKAEPHRFLNGIFRGWAMKLDITAVVSQGLHLSWSNFGLSGNDDALIINGTNTYTGFVGVTPYWAWSGIFFNSGMNRNLYDASHAVSAGINGRGISGTGPKLYFDQEINFFQFLMNYHKNY